MLIRIRVHTYVINTLPHYRKLRIPASSKLRVMDLAKLHMQKGETVFMCLREPYFQELTLDVQHNH